MDFMIYFLFFFLQILLIGDMSHRPIEDLSILVDEFMLPVLTNPLNQDGWPEVVKKDVEYHIQEFRNVIAEVKGNISNQTILPMPTTIHRVMETELEILQGYVFLKIFFGVFKKKNILYFISVHKLTTQIISTTTILYIIKTIVF